MPNKPFETSLYKPQAVTVILVDDEEAIRKATRQWLNLAGIDVVDYASADAALADISAACNGVIVSDIRMPGMDGMQFARKVQAIDPDLPVILVTAHGDVQMAVKAMRDGVYDFIEKPVEPELLLDRIQRAGEKRALVLENRQLHKLVSQGTSIESRLLGQSEVMLALRQQIMQLCQTPVDLVINGATGTGKEMVARCLHDFSQRAEKPFVAVNCGAIPDNLFESELFGHEKGAFTGAHERRIGKIEHAHKGTLFLDEIESMPVNFQIKLLRVLQERKLERVGSNKEIDLDLWVIAATKENLASAAEKGNFREDFYYRFNVVELQLPKLCQRRDDIPLLFECFTRKAALQYQRECQPLSGQELAVLMDYDWPGNVRQLRNIAERYVLGIAKGQGIEALLGLALDSQDGHKQQGAQSLIEQVQAFERQTIIQALKRNKGSVLAVTEELDLPRRTLNNKMKLYGINRRDYLG